MLAALGLSVLTMQAGDITGTVTLKGTPPAEPALPALDATCGKLFEGPHTMHHYVVGKNGELANVVLALKAAPAGPKGDAVPPAVLDQKGCAYVPQILAVQTGQKILIKNSDPVAHNVHTEPAGSKPMNSVQAPGTPEIAYAPAKPEHFIKFWCDIHPWMFAWVSVFDHPYFAVSDNDGKFTIKNVPDGKYTVQAFHRKAALALSPASKEVEVKGGNVTADFVLEVPAAK
jgi:plastocyanin